jgi:hypothetical protein
MCRGRPGVGPCEFLPPFSFSDAVCPTREDKPPIGPGAEDRIKQGQGVTRASVGAKVLGPLYQPVEDAIARAELHRAGQLGSG